MKQLWEKNHPLINGLGSISAIVGILSMLGLEKEELTIMTFIIAIILIVTYFDKRIEQIERYIFSEQRRESMSLINDKKGLTDFAKFIITVLVGLLIFYVVKTIW